MSESLSPDTAHLMKAILSIGVTTAYLSRPGSPTTAGSSLTEELALKIAADTELLFNAFGYETVVEDYLGAETSLEKLRETPLWQLQTNADIDLAPYPVTAEEKS